MKYSKILLLTCAIFVGKNSVLASDLGLTELLNISNRIAQPLQEALSYEHAGHYQKSAQMYHACIQNKGIPDHLRAGAAGHLGFFYMNGKPGIPINYKAAISFFDWGAKREDVESIYNTGVMYVQGWGNDAGPDRGKAIEYFQRAGDLGDADALYNLGCNYVEIKQFEKAHNAFKKAEKKGYLLAIHNRIFLFMEGHGSRDQTIQNVRAALIENARKGCRESIFTLATGQIANSEGLAHSLDDQEALPTLIDLKIDKDIAQGKKKFEFLSTTELDRLSIMSKILLMRLSLTEKIEHKQKELLSFIERWKQKQEEMPVIKDQDEVKLIKDQDEVKQEPIVVPKEAEKKDHKDDPKEAPQEKSLPIKEPEIDSLDKLVIDLDVKQEPTRPVFDAQLDRQLDQFFNAKDKGILKNFAMSRETLKWRDMMKIFNVLKSFGVDVKETKSGIALRHDDTVTSLHKGHGRDPSVVDKGAAKDVRKFVEEIVKK